MNKIKLMYDVVRTLKEKEVFKGILKAEARKDQVKVFHLEKEFEKNALSGQVKSKISTELDYEGKKVKHESSTEFNMQNCCEGSHHDFMKHMHEQHQLRHGKCCGIKGKLSKIAFVLNTLNNMKVDEQGDKGTILSISINEIPQDLKDMIQEKMNHKGVQGERENHCCCMEEFCSTEDINMDIKAQINKNNEIEKVLLVVSGKQKKESNEICDINFEAELNLIW
jgi:hypothetical protein